MWLPEWLLFGAKLVQGVGGRAQIKTRCAWAHDPTVSHDPHFGKCCTAVHKCLIMP